MPVVAVAASGSRMQPAIVGGTSAAVGTFPWLALMQDDLGGGNGEQCTGTVVSSNVVLTAAHCAEDITTGVVDAASGFTVATGNVDPTEVAGQVSSVSQVLVYPSFDRTTLQGDAALLVLSTPTTAPAIPLATAADLSLIQPGSELGVAGWGLTAGGASTLPAILQWGVTVAQSPANCAALDNADSILVFDPTSEFCAVDYPSYAVGTCKGDSGGPAIAVPAANSVVEVGITSYGDPNCSTTVPSNFTRVDLVSPWIDGVIAAVAPPPPAPPPPPTPPPSPPPAPTPPAPSVPVAPQAGKYAGKTGQHDGHVYTTIRAAGVTRTNIEFNLHCPSGRRGPLVQTVVWNPTLTLTASGGAWAFATKYRDTQGNRYAIAGTFPAVGAATPATGTLTVTTRNGRCTTGLVHWSAATPTP